MTQPAEISFEMWSVVCRAVYSKWSVIAFFSVEKCPEFDFKHNLLQSEKNE